MLIACGHKAKDKSGLEAALGLDTIASRVYCCEMVPITHLGIHVQINRWCKMNKFKNHSKPLIWLMGLLRASFCSRMRR